MGALSTQFETMSINDNIHVLDQRKQQLQNDFSQLTSIFVEMSQLGELTYGHLDICMSIVGSLPLLMVLKNLTNMFFSIT
jgi:hypothetical protein